MSEMPGGAAVDRPPVPDSGAAVGASAGQMLRRAREAQGLAIEALAASIKVTPRKLELLEADRYDELPDATFARALAQTVCRTLRIDAAPVLALLPAARGHRIEQVSEGLNAPFRDRSARLDAFDWAPVARAAWAPLLLLALAAVVHFLPDGFFGSTAQSLSQFARGFGSTSVTTPGTLPPAADAPGAATAAQGGASAPDETPTVETVFSAPPSRPEATAAGASAAAVAAPSGSGPLQLRADAESWIEVKDGRERVLLSRSLQPGETVTLDGVLPLRVKIGNAAVTEVRFRGSVVDIAPMTTENIARLELK